MVRTRIVFWRWAIRWRSLPRIAKLSIRIALVALLVSVSVPHYLIKTQHHPPVGTYIALLGVSAAAVALRKDPPPIEKALWTLVFALLGVAEIRNLYVEDTEQAANFGTIKNGLDASNQGLQNTVNALHSTAQTLGGISTQLNGTSKAAQQAADSAKESVASITGADSYALIVPEIVPGGTPQDMDRIYLVPKVIGRHTVWDIHLAMSLGLPLPLAEITRSPLVSEFSLGAIDPSFTGVIVHDPLLLPRNQSTTYYIGIASRGPYIDEELAFRYLKDKWEYRLSASHPEQSRTPRKILKELDWTSVPIATSRNLPNN